MSTNPMTPDPSNANGGVVVPEVMVRGKVVYPGSRVSNVLIGGTVLKVPNSELTPISPPDPCEKHCHGYLDNDYTLGCVQPGCQYNGISVVRRKELLAAAPPSPGAGLSEGEREALRYCVIRPDGSLYAACSTLESAQHFCIDGYQIEERRK